MIQEIADKYGVKLYEVKKGDKYCEANGEENYHNSSYCAGSIYCKCGAGGCDNNAEIWLGFYDDDELRLISFFHELGHVTNDIKWDETPIKYVFFDYETVIDFNSHNCMKAYSLSILVLEPIQLKKRKQHERHRWKTFY